MRPCSPRGILFRMRCSITNLPRKPARERSRGMSFDYDGFFAEQLAALKAEGRYRVFANLERLAGRFPQALYRDEQGGAREVTVWCSNDYLAMGSHPVVTEAMAAAITRQGAGAGGTRNISGTNHLHVELERELAE